MLQPDLFFAYGLAGGLAVAGRKKLTEAPSPFLTKYFLGLCLWLSVFYVPQVLYLVWRFPGWESMFVAKSLSDYPPWFMSVYSVATIIMGALGFYITWLFLRKGRLGMARAQAALGIGAAVFMILVGWDGTGWKRLFYTGTGAEWAAGVAYPPLDWFKSPIVLTLLWLETIVMVPYAALFMRAGLETLRPAKPKEA